MTNSLKTNYRDGDSFSKKAKLEGYRSRSSLKLKEIQKKDNLIKKGMSVLDLGCFPGGWLQVSSEIVGKNGKVFGIDIQKTEPLEGVSTLKKSILDLTKDDFTEDILPFDIVLSDMAPNISGIAERDNALMVGLLEKVEFSIENFLKKGGSTIIKVFQGESLDYSKKFLKFYFEEVKVRKPNSSRPNSNETYILGINLKKQ